MDSAIAELVLLKTKDGEHLKLFRRKLEVNDGNCVFERVIFKSSGQTMELYDRKRGDFIESVVACIQQRYKSFETDPVICNCRTILSCPHWPRENMALGDYGNEEVTVLGNHFSEVLVANGCLVERLLSEWIKLKRHVKQHWQVAYAEKVVPPHGQRYSKHRVQETVSLQISCISS